MSAVTPALLDLAQRIGVEVRLVDEGAFELVRRGARGRWEWEPTPSAHGGILQPRDGWPTVYWADDLDTVEDDEELLHDVVHVAVANATGVRVERQDEVAGPLYWLSARWSRALGLTWNGQVGKWGSGYEGEIRDLSLPQRVRLLSESLKACREESLVFPNGEPDESVFRRAARRMTA